MGFESADTEPNGSRGLRGVHARVQRVEEAHERLRLEISGGPGIDGLRADVAVIKQKVEQVPGIQEAMSRLEVSMQTLVRDHNAATSTPSWYWFAVAVFLGIAAGGFLAIVYVIGRSRGVW